MKSVTVYHVDYENRTRVPIGWVMERRRAHRSDNLVGLIRMARQLYAASPQDAHQIVVDARDARLP